MTMEDNSGCLNFLMMFVMAITGLLTLNDPGALRPTQPPPQATAAVPLTTPALEITFLLEDVSATQAEINETLLVMGSRLRALQADGLIGPHGLTLAYPSIRVQMSAIDAETEVILAALRENGYIEFVDLMDTPAAEDPSGNRILTTAQLDREGASYSRVTGADGRTAYALGETPVFPTILDHEAILSASALALDFGGYAIELELTEAGAQRMGDFTEANIGRKLAIVLDGNILSAPTIQGRVTSPILITGLFTQSEAETLATQINSRPLPLQLSVAEVRSIAPAAD